MAGDAGARAAKLLPPPMSFQRGKAARRLRARVSFLYTEQRSTYKVVRSDRSKVNQEAPSTHAATN